MSTCQLEYDGHNFMSSEAAFQYAKAKTCGTQKDVIAVLAEKESYDAKSATKHIKVNRTWTDDRERVMKEILLLKFKNNQQHREKLLATGDLKLYEATQDRFWACGYSLSKSDNIKQGSLAGANKLGKLLEEVREEVKGDNKRP